MPMQVCMGASMMCTFGMAPSSLVVLPTNKVFTDMVPDANIMDHIPMTNIMPFGMCMSPSNPRSPPRLPRRWACSLPCPAFRQRPRRGLRARRTVLLGNMPTLDNVSELMCMWGGVITFVTPGEMTVMVP